jgi:exodeoxyribonuclease V beta subunit
MGSDIRSLLEALERPSNLGRVRQLAATIFFGKSMVHAGSLADESIYQIQDQLQVLADVMLKKGLAAFAANIESNAEIMSRMVAGNHGERNITDFAHVMELMASLSTGRGCTPSKALEIFNELIEIDDNNELVSRRVESDADAVKVLTIHAAKGLQFPCVIVADLWKPVVNRSSKGTIFYDEDRTRKIEIINAMPEERDLKRSQAVARLLNDEILQETKRLLYVALTRPQHYLGILRTQASSILQESIQLPDARAPLNEPPEIQLEGGEPMVELQLATFPAVTRTWMRTSFSGIASVHRSKDNNHFGSPANGFDEQKDQFDESDESNDDETFSQPHSSDNLPASAAFGSIIHEILENTDPSVHPLQEEIQRVVNDRVVSNQLRHLRDDICTMLSDAMTTPFGHPLGELSLSSFSKADRLVEVDFDLGLASLTRGICVRDIGCTLVEMLDDHDPLWEYSHFLVNSDSRILIGGLLTGSIDAVLRMPNCANGKTQFIICDYKSNRLPAETSGNSLHAYAPDRLWIAMKHHHYPLQALLYGTALFRMLRWRAPDLDPDEAITGIVYAFLRGMRGSTTPVDKNGRRFGVVTWRAPAGLWKKLSDVLAGNKGTGN